MRHRTRVDHLVCHHKTILDHKDMRRGLLKPLNILQVFALHPLYLSLDALTSKLLGTDFVLMVFSGRLTSNSTANNALP